MFRIFRTAWTLEIVASIMVEMFSGFGVLVGMLSPKRKHANHKHDEHAHDRNNEHFSFLFKLHCSCFRGRLKTNFNIIGIVVIYGIPFLREIPIYCAETIAEKAVKNKLVPVFYLVGIFVVVPLLIILAST